MNKHSPFFGAAAIKASESLVFLKRHADAEDFEFRKSCQRMINELIKEFPDFVPHYEDVDSSSSE